MGLQARIALPAALRRREAGRELLGFGGEKYIAAVARCVSDMDFSNTCRYFAIVVFVHKVEAVKQCLRIFECISSGKSCDR